MTQQQPQPSRQPRQHRRSSPLLVVAVGFALAALVGLNVAINRGMGDGGAHSAEAAAPDTGQPSPTDPRGQAGAAADLVEMPVDVTFGSPGSAREIVIGWSWTPEVQADPRKVYRVIEIVKRAAASSARVRVVNVDAVPGVAPGIAVQGKSVVPLPADGELKMDQVGRIVLGGGPPR